MLIHKKVSSVVTSEVSVDVDSDDGDRLWQSPIVKAFLADDNVQQVTIVSANVGTTITLQKY